MLGWVVLIFTIIVIIALLVVILSSSSSTPPPGGTPNPSAFVNNSPNHTVASNNIPANRNQISYLQHPLGKQAARGQALTGDTDTTSSFDLTKDLPKKIKYGGFDSNLPRRVGAGNNNGSDDDLLSLPVHQTPGIRGGGGGNRGTSGGIDNLMDLPQCGRHGGIGGMNSQDLPRASKGGRRINEDISDLMDLPAGGRHGGVGGMNSQDLPRASKGGRRINEDLSDLIDLPAGGQHNVGNGNDNLRDFPRASKGGRRINQDLSDLIDLPRGGEHIVGNNFDDLPRSSKGGQRMGQDISDLMDLPRGGEHIVGNSGNGLGDLPRSGKNGQRTGQDISDLMDLPRGGENIIQSGSNDLPRAGKNGQRQNQDISDLMDLPRGGENIIQSGSNDLPRANRGGQRVNQDISDLVDLPIGGQNNVHGNNLNDLPRSGRGGANNNFEMSNELPNAGRQTAGNGLNNTSGKGKARVPIAKELSELSDPLINDMILDNEIIDGGDEYGERLPDEDKQDLNEKLRIFQDPPSPTSPLTRVKEKRDTISKQSITASKQTVSKQSVSVPKESVERLKARISKRSIELETDILYWRKDGKIIPIQLPLVTGEHLINITEYKSQPLVLTSYAVYLLGKPPLLKKFTFAGNLSKIINHREKIYGLSSGAFCQLVFEGEQVHLGALEKIPMGISDCLATRNHKVLLLRYPEETQVGELVDEDFKILARTPYQGPIAVGLSNYQEIGHAANGLTSDSCFLDDNGQLVKGKEGIAYSQLETGAYWFLKTS